MDNNLIGVVYKITNNINNKKYIGITTDKNGFKGRYEAKGKGVERLYNFLSNNKKYGQWYNKHLFNSINKYGIENFDVDEEFDIAHSKEELINKEIYWIQYYKCDNELYGYNHTIGGDGVTKSYLSKFISRFNNSGIKNDKYKYWTEGLQSHRLLGLWEDFGYGFSKIERELIRRKFWNRKTKICKLCKTEYYRKYDSNNLCDFCNTLSKEEIREVKKYLKEKIKN